MWAKFYILWKVIEYYVPPIAKTTMKYIQLKNNLADTCDCTKAEWKQVNQNQLVKV